MKKQCSHLWNGYTATKPLANVKDGGNIRLEVPVRASRSFNSTGETVRKRTAHKKEVPQLYPRFHLGLVVFYCGYHN